jgi:leucyl aminopeptidase
MRDTRQHRFDRRDDRLAAARVAGSFNTTPERPMSVELKTKLSTSATPIHTTDRATFKAIAGALPAATRRWFSTVGFDGAPDTHVLLPDDKGALQSVWAGVHGAAHPYALSALPRVLPTGSYRLDDSALAIDAQAAALSWSLGCYGFNAYKLPRRAPGTLQMAKSDAAARGLRVAAAICAARNLINTPAEHLGPAELAEAVRSVANAHGAKFKETVGEALLTAGFPAIHAVGRAAAREPRLAELTWGNPKHPKLTLVGKGVCFDTGGLNIKGPEGMRQMKKDMGGAATALALADLVMGLGLPVRLHLLIPAVENAISGNAYRPGDVITTRAGVKIEIGNTDAEGRVILCDALAYGAQEKPALMIDMATLTGAARVALGPQLPALFSRSTELARSLVDRGFRLHDPMWHMPLWQPYHAGIESDVADIVNTGKGPMAGAINAALFLADFVPDTVPWLHIDLYAGNESTRPGRPAGGEAQTVRTLLDYLEERFGQ